jgi:hypothetical protein
LPFTYTNAVIGTACVTDETRVGSIARVHPDRVSVRSSDGGHKTKE